MFLIEHPIPAEVVDGPALREVDVTRHAHEAAEHLPMSASSFSLGVTPAPEFVVAFTITTTRI